MIWSFWFFFFFQAEDGIRDDLVTGVQTCALPISMREQLLNRRGREGLQQLLAHGGIGIFVLDGLQHFECVRAAPESTLRLRGPVQRILAEQRVVLRFEEPPETLSGTILREFFVAESKRRARSPDVCTVLDGEGRKFLISAGRGVVERAGEFGKFFLRGL